MPRQVPKAAWKLFERMRNSRAGWGADDFHTVYTGFGFVCREGRDRVYIHPDHPGVIKIVMVGRHRALSKAYGDDCVRRIEQLIALEHLTRET